MCGNVAIVLLLYICTYLLSLVNVIEIVVGLDSVVIKSPFVVFPVVICRSTVLNNNYGIVHIKQDFLIGTKKNI